MSTKLTPDEIARIQEELDEPCNWRNLELILHHWDLAHDDKKQEAINYLSYLIGQNHWGAPRDYYNALKSNVLGKDMELDLFTRLAKSVDGHNGTVKLTKIWKLITKRYKKDVRGILSSKKIKNSILSRYLITLDDYTLDEEVLALRSLARSSVNLADIIESKYTPSKEALVALPSVMRIKCLENLTSQCFWSYNLFKNIKDEEEFKGILFGAVLRHPDRISNLVDRYCEISNSGKVSEVNIKYSCELCGDIEVAINSKIIGSKQTLNNTAFSMLTRSGCPVCLRYSTEAPKVNITHK